MVGTVGVTAIDTVGGGDTVVGVVVGAGGDTVVVGATVVVGTVVGGTVVDDGVSQLETLTVIGSDSQYPVAAESS